MGGGDRKSAARPVVAVRGQGGDGGRVSARWPGFDDSVTSMEPATSFLRTKISWHTTCVLRCAQSCHIVGSQRLDRKSTRLNSSHLGISYAVFCFKK